MSSMRTNEDDYVTIGDVVGRRSSGRIAAARYTFERTPTYLSVPHRPQGFIRNSRDG